MQLHIDDNQKAVRCSDEISQKAREHAWRSYPVESVGCISGGRYVELRNESPQPGSEFIVEDYPDKIEALVHSHPDMRPHPSAADMAQQQAMGVPWGIIGVDGQTAQTSEVEWFGDTCPIPPLVGRTFLSGVRDCWCLVRDWYRINHPDIGDRMPQLPRDYDWYRHGVDLLSRENISLAGFRIVDNRGDLHIGDIVMGRIASRVVNHCGVLIQNGLVLSHTEGRLSRREVVGPWVRRAEYVLRHRSLT